MNFLHDGEYKMVKSHLKTIIDKLEECEKNIKNTKDQEIYIENKIDVVNKNINLIKDKQNKSYEKIKKYIKLRNDLMLNNDNDEMSNIMLKIYNIILYEYDKITDEIDKSRYFQELETLNTELLNLNNLKNDFFEKSEKYKKFIFEIEN